jgi:lysyl-tRNA synthetase, class II
MTGESASLSSVAHQRTLRIERALALKALGQDPFAIESTRDMQLMFLAFWFRFVHSLDFEELRRQISPYSPEYLVYQALFPKDIVEQANEMVRLRTLVKQMGLDPDSSDFKEFNDIAKTNEIRELFPDIAHTSKEQRFELFNAFFTMHQGQKIPTPALKKNQKITIAGRIKSKRVSGKIGFFTIEDESYPAGFQVICKSDELPENMTTPVPSLTFDQCKELLDESDYIQVTGYTDYSLRGEPSLFAQHIQILTKALRPLPVSMPHDELEARYLNRVADLKLNTADSSGLGIRDLLRKKSHFWRIWREEMLALDFLEVETPVFELTPGGAEARPFVTHYEAMDIDVYLRISPELNLKRLIAGGFERVFEIGRIFRNEGASPQHLQEYTQIEFYWAYTDYRDVMRLVQRIYTRIVQMVLDGRTTQTDYYGNTIEWGAWCTQQVADEHGWLLMGGWPLIPFFDAVRHFSGGTIDIEHKTLPELRAIADSHHVKYEPADSLARLLDLIYKKTARQHIHNPIFLILPPVELEPLAKRDSSQPNLTQRFQIVAGTAEIGKGFSELNDPLDQMERFESQQAARDAGDAEAQFMDTGYVEALEYGTPPMGGFGVSERFFSFLTGTNIKECVTFPFVKPPQTGEK